MKTEKLPFRVSMDTRNERPFDWPLTLHADLRNTTLADFDEHFSNAVFRHDDALLGQDMMRPPYRTVRDDLPGPQSWRNTPEEAETWEMYTENGETLIRRVVLGTTGIGYFCHFRFGEGPQWGGFTLTAVHYRQDRLKIVVAEPEGESFAGRLRQWILQRWGDAYCEQPKEKAPKENFEIARPETYAGKELRTTLAHYLITELGYLQEEASRRVDVSRTTYRDHRDKGKLLSPEEFERRTGQTLAQAAKDTLGFLDNFRPVSG